MSVGAPVKKRYPLGHWSTEKTSSAPDFLFGYCALPPGFGINAELLSAFSFQRFSF
jgi:hypothetical protein